MHNYCTIVSQEYIHKLLLLYNSLLKHDDNFRFFIICMSKDTRNLLNDMKLDKAVLLTIDQIENTDPQLVAVKSGRNEKEYAWTSKGSVFLYLFNNYPDIDHLLWLDGDIFFYSSPNPIFQELRQCSLLLTKERFNEKNKKLNNVYGIYNTGLMGLKRDKKALDFIKWYRRSCIEWCYDKAIPGKFSDQMHLNKINERLRWIRVIKNIAINVTAWNVQGRKVEKQGEDIYIDGEKLVFYHFSGFRCISPNEFELCTYITLPKDVVKLIYLPYVKKYRDMIYYVNQFDSNHFKGFNLNGYKPTNHYIVDGD